MTGKLLRYFAFFWIAILSIAVVEYLGFKTNTGFLDLKQEAVKSGWYLPAFYSHIFGSSIILFVGYFQFSNRLRGIAHIHRILGRIYVYGILLLAAPGAFIMSFFINRGEIVFASFFIQNILWILFTVSSILLIKKGKYDQHSNMAVRSYSLAFAAVTLRFYVLLFNLFGNGAHFNHNYTLIALLSWIPNLLIAELLIRRKTYHLKKQE